MSEFERDNLLSVRGLKTHFAIGRRLWGGGEVVKAVDGVDLTVRRGRTLGLVGESGSGKTTVGRTLLRLIPATAGRVVFDGQDVFALPARAMTRLRRRMQIIFQDPASSLDPRMTIGHIVAEPLKVHFSMRRRQRRQRVNELLRRVGLAEEYANRYPHEFSGGQRQRVGIARALASQPDFILCDEPISALDVSIQAQILNLLSDLQDELGLSYLFIAHNLAVVEHFADDVAVMYLGRIVEAARKEIVLGRAGRLQHPYTEALLSAIPEPIPGAGKDRIRLPGEMPSPLRPPTGCPFHPRCPLTRRQAAELPDSETTEIPMESSRARVVKRCTEEIPELRPTRQDETHLHACLLRQ